MPLLVNRPYFAFRFVEIAEQAKLFLITVVAALLLEDVLVEVKPANWVFLISRLALLPDLLEDVLWFGPLLQERYDLVYLIGDHISVLILVQSFSCLFLLWSVRHIIFVNRFAFRLLLNLSLFLFNDGLQLWLGFKMVDGFIAHRLLLFLYHSFCLLMVAGWIKEQIALRDVEGRVHVVEAPCIRIEWCGLLHWGVGSDGRRGERSHPLVGGDVVGHAGVEPEGILGSSSRENGSESHMISLSDSLTIVAI